MNELGAATQVTNQLLTYGPLGIFCIVLCFAVWLLYRDSKKDREEFMSITKMYVENESKQSEVLKDLKEMMKEMWNKLK